MKILIYSYNDKIGDGLQKITFIQKLKSIYPVQLKNVNGPLVA